MGKKFCSFLTLHSFDFQLEPKEIVALSVTPAAAEDFTTKVVILRHHFERALNDGKQTNIMGM